MCPCCKESTEMSIHLLKCTANTAFESSMRTLRAKMCTPDAHPIRHLKHGGLFHNISAADGSFQPNLERYPLHMRQTISNALASQLRIGWQNVLKGYLSKEWRDLASMPRMIQDGKRVEAKGTQRMRTLLDSIHSHCVRLHNFLFNFL